MRPTHTEYAPYHLMRAFVDGYCDYQRGKLRNLDGVAGQAYDRGAELAMRQEMWNLRNKEVA